MTSVYPIILTPALIGRDGGYAVFVPDLDINTQGCDMAEAIFMARDAIGLWGITRQDYGRKIPEAANFKPPCAEDEITALVDIDFDAYRLRYNNLSVRKSLTIPAWLNDIAEKENVNFSQVLQQGLKQRLNIN
jgi:predicted RNase H-like HicB family nuclease